MQLMLKNTPVLSFDLEDSEYKVENKSLMPYSLRSSAFDPEAAESLTDLALAIRERDKEIIRYLSNRLLPPTRANSAEILNAFSYIRYQSEEDRAKIAIESSAISCSDSYWIKHDDDQSWTRLNPRKRIPNEKMIRIALLGEKHDLGQLKSSPELTTGGTFAKAWARTGGGFYLYKRSGSRRESEIEVEVSKLLDCLPVHHANYEKSHFNGETLCRCKCMADEERSVVPAEDVFVYFGKDRDKFLEWAFQLDMDNIYKMCVVDYLISNPDRGMQNWGFYQNNTTGFLTGCHPLFDHNRAFDPELIKLEDGGESDLFSNQSKLETARFAMSKCNMYFLRNPRRDDFFDADHYESLLQRADSLGIILK